MRSIILLLILGCGLCNLEKVIIDDIAVFKEKEDIMIVVNKNTEVEIIVRVGDVFTIEIPSNPTTGYEWFMEEEIEKISFLDGDPFGQIIVNDEMGFGAPGIQRFTFAADNEGSEIINLLYRRIWKPDDLLAIYQVRVIIE